MIKIKISSFPLLAALMAVSVTTAVQASHTEDSVKTATSGQCIGLCKAIQNADLERVKAYLNNRAPLTQLSLGGYSPLGIAAANGCMTEIASLLLEHGADLNQKDQYGIAPLCYSVVNGRTDMTRWLLNKKANPNVTCQSDLSLIFLVLRMEQVSGSMDKFVPDATKQLHLLKLLLEYGANPDLPFGDYTPLSYAAYHKKHEHLYLLLRYNANSNKIHHQISPLHAAAAAGDIKIINQLLKYNADPNLANDNRVTPYHIALNAGHHDAALRLTYEIASLHATDSDK